MTQKSLRFLEQKYPQNVIKYVHRWSDQCASQYKCKTAFRDLLNFKKDLGTGATFNFFETSEGKGACDGVGGTTKHGLDQLVLHQQVVIHSAYHAYLLAQQKLSNENRTYLYLPGREVEAFRRKYAKIPNVKRVIGTQQIHSATATADSDTQLKTRHLSCYCPVCQHRIDVEECHTNNIWKAVHLIPDKKLPENEAHLSDQTPEMAVSIPEGSPSDQTPEMDTAISEGSPSDQTAETIPEGNPSDMDVAITDQMDIAI